MQLIKVETEALFDAAKKINTHEEQYHQFKDELFKKVDALASAWQGSDNLAFSNQIHAYEADLNQISLLMSQYAQFINNSANAYLETQEGLRAEAQRLI